MNDDYDEFNYDELTRLFKNHHNLDDGWIENLNIKNGIMHWETNI